MATGKERRPGFVCQFVLTGLCALKHFLGMGARFGCDFLAP